MNEKVFMRMAVDLSIENVLSSKGGPFGAVIVSPEGKIVSMGANRVCSRNDPSAHAEIMAIRVACKKLNTPFLTDHAIFSSCEPCPMCFSCIRWAKIKNVFYALDRTDAAEIGFDDKKIYDEIVHNKQDMIRVECNKAKKAFELWGESKTKKTY